MKKDQNSTLSGCLIVFCGIDGSGKSSLVNQLEIEQTISGAKYVRKTNKTNLKRLIRYWPNKEESTQNWAVGPFAECVATATALDFLYHYKTEIAPLLQEGRVVICDRYDLCYKAYLHSTEAPLDYQALFVNIVSPNLLIYVDVPVEVAVQRHYQRGGPTKDEAPEVMARFRNAYLGLIPKNHTSNFLHLDNKQPFHDSFALTKTAILKVLENNG